MFLVTPTQSLGHAGWEGGQPRIRAGAATGVVRMIEEHRGDPDRLLAEAGVTRAELADPDRQIPLLAYCALFERAAQATGVDGFGLRFGQDRYGAITGPIGRLALASPTLVAALRSMTRYFPVWQESSVVTLVQQDSLARLGYQIRDGRIVARRQDAELTISAFVGLLRAVLGPNWRPEEIHFEHLRPRDASEHADILGAPVLFGAATNAIVFRAGALGAPMPTASPASVPLIVAELDGSRLAARADDIVGLVQHEVRAGLAAGDCGLPLVARRLGMAPATLHRRLRERGLTFSDLVRALRRELAIDHLSQPHIALTDIASLLGYAELSVFSRSFRHWTGMSATEWRRRHLDPG